MMQGSLKTRKATIADIPFLARIDYEASLPPLNECFWEGLLDGLGTSAQQFLEAVFKVEASNWGNVNDYLILEEDGKPIAAAAGFVPNAENYCPLRLDKLDAIAQELNWSAETMMTFRDRYVQIWGEDPKPLFLKPIAPWVIESVAVLPEARGRGLGKVLLKAMLEEARSQHYSHAGIMVINGNDIAKRAYEAIGFKLYQTYYAEYFSQEFNFEFPGFTKLSCCLN